MQTRYDFLRIKTHKPEAALRAQSTLAATSRRMLIPQIPEKNLSKTEIVNIFGQLENKQKVITRKRAFLQDLFRTLLHELMTAKIRVHDLNFQEK